MGHSQAIHRLPQSSLYGRFLSMLSFNHRGFMAFVILTAVFVTARPTDTSIVVGVILSLVGEFLRIWAAGFGYKEGEFSLSGPYKFVRHPYFLGSILFYLGLCIAGRNVWVTGAALLILTVGFRRELKADEERLAQHLGPNFTIYKARVPAFFPQLLPLGRAGTSLGVAAAKAKFSLGSAVFTGRHRELDALLISALAFASLYLCHWLNDLKLFHMSMAAAMAVFFIGRIVFVRLVFNRK
jgi:protein-S-isoprenylcysteine O-methyltransferase Ste14